jgi:hypothetical protein
MIEMPQNQSAIEMIKRQIDELSTILKQTTQDLNTVRGHERVTAWKKRTVELLAKEIGPKDAQRFASTSPGPSFTNDLMEELSDEIEVYHTFLQTLARHLEHAPS